MENEKNSKLLCSWGLHFYNKKVQFYSDEVELKFEINICPRCKYPSKRTLKLLLGKSIILPKNNFQRIVTFLRDLVSGNTYGENEFIFRRRTAKNLLETLEGKEKNN